MFSHVTIGSSDPNKAAAEFYDAVFEVLGVGKMFEIDGIVAYGEPTGPKTFVLRPFDGGPHVPGNGGHIAYVAQSRAQVDEFHATALAAGGTDEGPPGLRPHFHANYYGAYVRDREGNKIQAVCHSKGG